jgi:hypothetical protein
MTFLPLHQQPRDDERSQHEHEHEQQHQHNNESFHFAIPLLESEEDGTCACDDVSAEMDHLSVPQDTIDRFQKDGFAVFKEVISTDAVEALNDRLEDVLRGVYDRGRTPDKVPRLVKGHKPQRKLRETTTLEPTTTTTPEAVVAPNKSTKNKKRSKKPGGGNSSSSSCSIGPIGFSGNFENVKVLQIINMHKADSLFRKLETSPSLARVVSKLAKWDHWGGARLAQDQFWGKPPGAPPLVFHRDSPYFMFDPPEVVTVWIALDDMDDELGPLEYVVGSHTWGDGRIGSANQFFQADTTKLLLSAAEREGIDDPSKLEFVSMGGLGRGGLSIHHGKIWHGSAKNSSRNKPRRGLGLHFVPASVRFTAEASKSRLWKPYVAGVDDPSKVELSEEDFPLSV